ncbi:MAG: type II toxin-antitoxin system RelE/ParE family toxin [Hyphomicrobiales bacterium]|nr:type II toxin-antitoxin system RelE/ParE family toxin [Hyphomicrobiales bacterium]
MKTIIFTLRAAKELDALPEQARAAIDRALGDYAISGRGDVKSLKGKEGYRMRVGSYRVLFDVDKTTVLAISVGRRVTTTYRK